MAYYGRLIRSTQYRPGVVRVFFLFLLKGFKGFLFGLYASRGCFYTFFLYRLAGLYRVQIKDSVICGVVLYCVYHVGDELYNGRVMSLGPSLYVVVIQCFGYSYRLTVLGIYLRYLGRLRFLNGYLIRSYLLNGFNGSAIGGFSVKRGGLRVGYLGVTHQVGKAISISGVNVLRAARCVCGHVSFPSVNGRLISRSLSLTNAFCGSYGVGGFSYNEYRLFYVVGLARLCSSLVQGQGSSCI